MAGLLVKGRLAVRVHQRALGGQQHVPTPSSAAASLPSALAPAFGCMISVRKSPVVGARGVGAQEVEAGWGGKVFPQQEFHTGKASCV